MINTNLSDFIYSDLTPDQLIELGGVPGPQGPQGPTGPQGPAGSGDMNKSVYDTNDDGTVDNADTVNGFTVGVNVPADAKFTDTVTTINGKTGTIVKADITALGIPAQDTVYSHPATHSADMITDGTNNKVFTTAEQYKLNRIEDEANKYVHPANHSADDIVDGTTNKAYTTAEKSKLAGMDVGANKYVHPGTHSAQMIDEDVNHRFVSDFQMGIWDTSVLNEPLRVQAENSRVIAESSRVTAENARKVWEAYDNGKAYVIGNKVYYNGSSYYCIKASTGNLPTNTTFWQQIASSQTTANNVSVSDAAGHFTATNVEDALAETANIVSTNTAYLDKLETYMGSFIQDFLPYGGAWNKQASPILTRTEFAEGMTAAIGVDNQVVTNNFDGAPIYREIHKVVDTLGNEFVRIPKFYIKKTDAVGSKTVQISKYQHEGFYLPKCFWDFTRSVELPYFDFGCYNASLNGTKLASLPNTYPLINKNIVDFRTYAQNNNADGLSGYQQLDVHAIDVLQTLFFVEFGTLNAQAVMAGYTGGNYSTTHVATVAETGVNRIIVANAYADLFKVGQTISIGTSLGGNQIFYGRTITAIDVYDASNKAISFDGAAVNIAVGNVIYNTGWKSGFSSNVTASSGVITANTGKYPCSYRGIENPFGSVYQFVDGVNIVDGQAWICDNPAQYASNVFASPYEKLSYVNGGTNGHVTAMGYDPANPFAEFPTSVGGGTTTYYSDYYYRDAGNRIALFGGHWTYGASAGLSAWYLYSSSAYTYIALGGRLLKKPL